MCFFFFVLEWTAVDFYSFLVGRNIFHSRMFKTRKSILNIRKSQNKYSFLIKSPQNLHSCYKHHPLLVSIFWSQSYFFIIISKITKLRFFIPNPPLFLFLFLVFYSWASLIIFRDMMGPHISTLFCKTKKTYFSQNFVGLIPSSGIELLDAQNLPQYLYCDISLFFCSSKFDAIFF